MTVFNRLNATGTAKWEALCNLADTVCLYRLVIDRGIGASSQLDDHLAKQERRYRAAADAYDQAKKDLERT